MKKLLIILLSLTSLSIFAQAPSKKCPTCGQSMAKCQYKGKHPQKTPNFTVQKKKPTRGVTDGHEWVDLGLPSGTKWATMNVGASSPSDYGSHFAWGETKSKTTYFWNNLKYCIDTEGNKFSKYVLNSEYGTVDGKNELEPGDDAAYANWGPGWCIPSKTQIDELREKCKWIWTTKDGRDGYEVRGANENSIFIPAAGWKNASEYNNIGTCGIYWCRTLDEGGARNTYTLHFDVKGIARYEGCSRCGGFSLRAVKRSK